MPVFNGPGMMSRSAHRAWPVTGPLVFLSQVGCISCTVCTVVDSLPIHSPNRAPLSDPGSIIASRPCLELITGGLDHASYLAGWGGCIVVVTIDNVAEKTRGPVTVSGWSADRAVVHGVRGSGRSRIAGMAQPQGMSQFMLFRASGASPIGRRITAQ